MGELNGVKALHSDKINAGKEIKDL